VATNGAFVASWLDQSSDNNDAAQTLPSFRPIYTDTGISGRPSIRFLGTNYFTLPSTLFAGVTEGEAFVVLQATANRPAVNRGLWLMGDGSSSYYPTTVGTIEEGFGVTNVTILTSDPSQRIDQPHIYDVLSKTNEWTSRINGVIHYSQNVNPVYFQASPPRLGSAANDRYFDGYISEVLFYARALTADERFSVGTYLAHRYSLFTPPAAPTNLLAFGVSTNQISLTWSSQISDTNTSFTIQRQSGSGCYSNVAVLQNSLSYLDSGLAPATQYYYRVGAANYAGLSGLSFETSATTLTDGTAIPLDAVQVWLKGDSGHGGNPINCWVDQTTNGNDAYHAPPDTGPNFNKPTWVPNGISARPALYFFNTNVFFLPAFSSGWTQAEVFIVLKTVPPPSPGTAGLWIMGSGGSYYPDPADGTVTENFGRSAYPLNTGPPGITLTNAHLYNVMSKAGDWINRFNNTNHYETTDNMVVGFASPPRLGWGANQQFFRGYIAEIMIFNRELTSAERSTVATVYLRQRFGLW
jgi:hypothetical protein